MFIPILDIDALDDPPDLSKTEIIIGKTIFCGSILCGDANAVDKRPQLNSG